MADEQSGQGGLEAKEAAPTLEIRDTDRPDFKERGRERYFLPAALISSAVLIGAIWLHVPWLENLPRIVIQWTKSPTPPSATSAAPATAPEAKAAPSATVVAVTPVAGPHPAAEALGLSAEVAASPSAGTKRSLEVLAREQCDARALQRLATTLEAEDRRRDAAKARVSFSRRCDGHYGFLHAAASNYYDLTDYPMAVEVASELIQHSPHASTGYYLRGLARAKLGEHAKAVDDLVTTIELVGVKQRISSIVYLSLAQSHEALGQLCDAADAIESWVAINPSSHDTSQTRTMISGYDRRGDCAANNSGSRDVFPVAEPNAVVIVPVFVNGVRARFVVDTGASFVSMTREFAEKAGVEIDTSSTVLLHTANGIAKAHRGRAREIKLKTIGSTKVPVIVQDKEGGYAPGVDGLLGMSFLSRFDVSISGGSLRIARKGS